MNMGESVSIDAVVLEIQTKAGDAGKKIDELANKLAKLRDSMKGGFNNLNKLSDALKKMSKDSKNVTTTVQNLKPLKQITPVLKGLQEIKAPSGLNKVIQRLNELNKASKSLTETANNLKNIGDVTTPLQSLVEIKNPTGLNAVVKRLQDLSKLGSLDDVVSEVAKLPQIVEPMNKLSEIMNPKGFKNAIDNLAKLPEVIKKFDTKTFENLKRVSEELAQSLTPLAEKMQNISEGYSAFSKIQNTFGKSATTVSRTLSKQKTLLSSVFNMMKRGISLYIRLSNAFGIAFGKKSQKQMDKFASKFKQVYLSLLGTRTLFTMIRKAASEYMAFDTSLQKFTTNIWRAFGAQLAPAIEYAMELFKQFVRVIYSVVYAITGIDLIARANAKAMDAWSKSAKDALGNLQKFDDLNVVEFPKGDEDKELITMDKIDLSPIQKVIDWVRRLKEEIQTAFETGQWYEVGKVFTEGISDGIKFLLNNIDVIKTKIKDSLAGIGDFINGMVAGADWEAIGEFVMLGMMTLPKAITTLLQEIEWEKIGQGLTDYLKGFNLGEVITAKTETWVTIVDSLQTALLNADWVIIGERLSQVLIAWTGRIPAILKTIKFEEVGKRLGTALAQIDWKEVFSNILTAFKEFFKGIGEFGAGLLEGIFDLDVGTIDPTLILELGGALLLLGVALTALIKLKSSTTGIGKGLSSIGDGFGGLMKGLGTAVTAIAILGGLALVLESLSSVLTAFSDTGFTAAEGISFIVTLLGSLAVAVIGMTLAFQSMDTKSIVAGLVTLAGISAVFITLGDLLDSITKTGFTAGETMGVLAVVMGSVIALIAAMTIAANALQNPMAMAGVAVIVAAIAATMFTLKETLPTILDACAKFINDIGPFVIELVKTIGILINEIIKSLGTVLPPIINSVGKLFDIVFSGIAKVIQTVGDTIVRIMNTAASLVERVLSAILKFINELGPAINRFVDNSIAAVTKLINFIVSAVEYLINTAIIKPINSLIRKINNNAIAEALDWKITTLSTVSVDRFAPKLATGTNEIPQEGLYHLHPGEAVVPKKYNPALGNGGSEEMVAKMDTLIDIMNNMNFTNIVNVGNKKLYEGQQAFNKTQQNKYGTINLY